MRKWLYIFVASLVAAATGVFTNIASTQLPHAMEPYLWLSWPLLAIFSMFMTVLATYVYVAPPKENLPSTPLITRSSYLIKIGISIVLLLGAIIGYSYLPPYRIAEATWCKSTSKSYEGLFLTGTLVTLWGAPVFDEAVHVRLITRIYPDKMREREKQIDTDVATDKQGKFKLFFPEGEIEASRNYLVLSYTYDSPFRFERQYNRVFRKAFPPNRCEASAQQRLEESIRP